MEDFSKKYGIFSKKGRIEDSLLKKETFMKEKIIQIKYDKIDSEINNVIKIPTWKATRQATDDATYSATINATSDATIVATRNARYNATSDIIENVVKVRYTE